MSLIEECYPKTWDGLVGQDVAVKMLQEANRRYAEKKSSDVPFMLLVGPHGVGKTAANNLIISNYAVEYTTVNDIPDKVKSSGIIIPFRQLTDQDVRTILHNNFPDLSASLDSIVYAAHGNVKKAISCVEQLQYADFQVTMQQAQLLFYPPTFDSVFKFLCEVLLYESLIDVFTDIAQWQNIGLPIQTVVQELVYLVQVHIKSSLGFCRSVRGSTEYSIDMFNSKVSRDSLVKFLSFLLDFASLYEKISLDPWLQFSAEITRYMSASQ